MVVEQSEEFTFALEFQLQAKSVPSGNPLKELNTLGDLLDKRAVNNLEICDSVCFCLLFFLLRFLQLLHQE